MKQVKSSVYLKRRFRKAKLNKGNDSLSFKEFVRKLAQEGDEQALAWFKHKSRTFNHEAKELRLKNKGGRIAAEKSAKRMAQSRSSSKGKSSGP
jgi:hypothetical protein